MTVLIDQMNQNRQCDQRQCEEDEGLKKCHALVEIVVEIQVSVIVVVRSANSTGVNSQFPCSVFFAGVSVWLV